MVLSSGVILCFITRGHRQHCRHFLFVLTAHATSCLIPSCLPHHVLLIHVLLLHISARYRSLSALRFAHVFSSTDDCQKTVSVIFDNHRALCLASVVLVPRSAWSWTLQVRCTRKHAHSVSLSHSLVVSVPRNVCTSIHAHPTCSFNGPIRYQSSFNHSPVVFVLLNVWL